MTTWISVFTVLVLLLAFILVALSAQAFRRRQRLRLTLRRIPAYRAMYSAVSEAVEAERPMHFSFGGSGLGNEATVSALASAELLYHLAERAALASHPPIVSLSDPTALGLAQGTLRRAYEARKNMEAYRSSAARWYPQGPRSLAFGAGVAATLAQEDSSMSVLSGRFGPEIAFIGETAIRYDQVLFAQSDQLDGQAVAWVMSEMPLIGEELYVAGAYLPQRPDPLHISQVLAMDILRLVAIVGIILFALYSSAQDFVRSVLDNPGPFIVVGVVVLVLAFGGGGLIWYLRSGRQSRKTEG